MDGFLRIDPIRDLSCPPAMFVVLDLKVMYRVVRVSLRIRAQEGKTRTRREKRDSFY